MSNVKCWPNIITTVRILLAPVLVVVYYAPIASSHVFAALVFVLASVSDWLDGYVARSMGQTTKLGAFLDPVADKIIVVLALIMLVAQPGYAIIVLPVMTLVVREIIVSGLREWMSELGKRASVAVSYVGKFKTGFQMVAITILLLCKPSAPDWVLITGYVLLYISALLSVWSMVIYLKAAWPAFDFQRP